MPRQLPAWVIAPHGLRELAAGQSPQVPEAPSCGPGPEQLLQRPALPRHLGRQRRTDEADVPRLRAIAGQALLALGVADGEAQRRRRARPARRRWPSWTAAGRRPCPAGARCGPDGRRGPPPWWCGTRAPARRTSGTPRRCAGSCGRRRGRRRSAPAAAAAPPPAPGTRPSDPARRWRSRAPDRAGSDRTPPGSGPGSPRAAARGRGFGRGRAGRGGWRRGRGRRAARAPADGARRPAAAPARRDRRRGAGGDVAQAVAQRASAASRQASVFMPVGCPSAAACS